MKPYHKEKTARSAPRRQSNSILAVTLAGLAALFTACDNPPSPPDIPQKGSLPASLSTVPAGFSSPPPPASSSEDERFVLAAELAASRFFLANPNTPSVSWPEIAEQTLALLGLPPGTTAPESIGDKIYIRPATTSPPSPAPPDSPSAEQSSSTSFGITIKPATISAARGQEITFVATPEGLSEVAEYHFAVVPENTDPGVDEVPYFEEEPSKSPEYTVAFEQLGTGRVMVRGYDSAGQSARAFSRVEITNRPPEIRGLEVPESVFRGQVIKPSVEVSDPDGDKVDVLIVDPSGEIAGDREQMSFALDSLGEWEMTIKAVDSLGAETTRPITIAVTNRPPEFAGSADDLHTHPGSRVEVNAPFVDPDADPMELRATYGTQSLEQLSPGVFQVAPEEPGRHPITIEATDSHGGSTSQTIFVEVKNRPPAITLLQSPVTTHRDQTTRLIEGASDPDGDSVRITTVVDGQERQWTAGEEVTASFSSLGTHEVLIIAEDSRGAKVEEKVAVTVSNAPPTVTLAIEPEQVYRGAEVKIVAAASDPEGEDLLYKFEGPGVTSSASTSPEVRITPSESGEISVSVLVSDPHGGVATAKKQIMVQPRPPEVELALSPASGTRLDEFNLAVAVRCPETGEPPKDIRVLEPLGWKRTKQGFSGVFRDIGEQKVVVEALSLSGVTGRAEVRAQISNIPPTVEVLSPEAPHHRSRPARFAVRYADSDGSPDPAAVEWTVDGGSIISKDGNTAVIEYEKLGPVTVKALVEDSDGGKTEAFTSVEVENLPPTISIAQPPGPYHRAQPVEIRVEASDIDDPEFTPEITALMGSSPLPVEGGIVTIIPDRLGEYEVQVSTTDAQGARSEKSATFTVENSTPQVVLEISEKNPPLDSEVMVTAQAEDLETSDLKYEFEVNGVRLPRSGENTLRMTMTKSGPHSISVTVVDADGASATAKGDLRVK